MVLQTDEAARTYKLTSQVAHAMQNKSAIRQSTIAVSYMAPEIMERVISSERADGEGTNTILNTDSNDS